jgi:hypothetical protein
MLANSATSVSCSVDLVFWYVLFPNNLHSCAIMVAYSRAANSSRVCGVTFTTLSEISSACFGSSALTLTC